jgi:hypothetical protein
VVSRTEESMSQLSIYTWHEGQSTCDKVFQMPASLTMEEALGLALLKLQCDPDAVQVEIEFEEAA